MTAKPSRARRSATYRPMPPDATVTRATLACTSVIDVLPLGTGLSAASRASTLVFGRPPGAGGRHRTNLSARTRQTDEGNFYRGDVVEWAGSSLGPTRERLLARWRQPVLRQNCVRRAWRRVARLR